MNGSYAKDLQVLSLFLFRENLFLKMSELIQVQTYFFQKKYAFLNIFLKGRPIRDFFGNFSDEVFGT